MGSAPHGDARIGSILNERYEILEYLAQGAMGAVYRGRRTELDRAVAIKFLHATFAAEASLLERFKVEAMTMSRPSHPNCVPVIDMGIDDTPYIVMDFVEGVSLSDLLDQGAVAPRRAINIVRQVLAGLAHAHALGIIHRDVKPANIMLSEAEGSGDHVRILDFGLAKIRGSERTLTGMVLGTPSYMAPEQATGGEIDLRTDLYAVGIVLFYLLSGQKPFQSEETYELIRMHVEVPPPRLADCSDLEFSDALESLVGRALSKHPDGRPQSAEEFADALGAVPEATGVLPQRGRRRPVRTAVSGRFPIRRFAIAGAVLLGLAALSVFIGREAIDKTSAAARGVIGKVSGRSDDAAVRPSASTVDEARALARDGDVDGAIAALHDLRRLDTHNAEVPAALGDLYFEKDWPAEGLAAYRNSVALDQSKCQNKTMMRRLVTTLEAPETREEARKLLLYCDQAAVPELRRASDTGPKGAGVHARRVLDEIR